MKKTLLFLTSLMLACGFAFAQDAQTKAEKEAAKKAAEEARIAAKNVWQKDQKRGAVEDQLMDMNKDKEPDLKKGFVSIFDGKTLKGWKQVSGNATFEVRQETVEVKNGREIKGGVIYAEKNPADDAKGIQVNSFLVTEKNYKNFIFTIEYKWLEMGNSGVQILSRMDARAKDMPRVQGPQIEIETSKRGWTGGIYSERAGGGWKYSLSREDHADAREAVKKNDEWNRLTIESKNGIIKTWVNGVPCTNFDLSKDKDMKIYEEGFIGMQVHHGQKGITLFKNIKIKELK